MHLNGGGPDSGMHSGALGYCVGISTWHILSSNMHYHYYVFSSMPGSSTNEHPVKNIYDGTPQAKLAAGIYSGTSMDSGSESSATLNGYSFRPLLKTPKRPFCVDRGNKIQMLCREDSGNDRLAFLYSHDSSRERAGAVQNCNNDTHSDDHKNRCDSPTPNPYCVRTLPTPNLYRITSSGLNWMMCNNNNGAPRHVHHHSVGPEGADQHFINCQNNARAGDRYVRKCTPAVSWTPYGLFS